MGPLKWMLLSLFVAYLMLPEEYSYLRPVILVGVVIVLLLHIPAVYYSQKLLPEESQISPRMLPYVLLAGLVPLGYITYTLFNKAKEQVATKKKTASSNAGRK